MIFSLTSERNCSCICAAKCPKLNIVITDNSTTVCVKSEISGDEVRWKNGRTPVYAGWVKAGNLELYKVNTET